MSRARAVHNTVFTPFLESQIAKRLKLAVRIFVMPELPLSKIAFHFSVDSINGLRIKGEAVLTFKVITTC